MVKKYPYLWLGLSFVSIFGFVLVTAAVLSAHSTGPKAGVNGGLSQQTCIQTDCHISHPILNDPQSLSQITLSGFPTTYIPGQQYTLSITVGLINPANNTSPPRRRYGFQLSARSVSNPFASLGTLTLTDSDRTGYDFQLGDATSPTPVEVNGVVYVSHTPPGTCFGPVSTSCTWTVIWTAPDTAQGTVEFDVGGNSANGDRDNTGDYILQKTVFANPAAPPPAPQFAASNPISPNTGGTNGGITITINGANFANGAVVFFGSMAAATAFVDATQLTAILPTTTTPGAVPVKVQNPDSQSATLPGAFTYILSPAPQFSSSSASFPHIGTLSGGTTVTLNGSNFVNGATVLFGGNPAVTTFVSSTQLTAVAPPAAATGAVDLIVKNPDGQTATLTKSFTYFDDSKLKIAYAVATSATGKRADEEASATTGNGTDTSGKTSDSGATSIAPVGSGVFSFSQGNFLVTTVGTPSATPTKKFLMFADSKPFPCPQPNCALQNNTGLAVINLSGSTAHLSYILLNPDGTATPFNAAKTLVNGAHDQGFITDFFGANGNNFTGTLEVDSDVPVNALTLQLNSNQAPRSETLFTSLPVADLTAAAPSGNLIFAHLLDGGGFQTRIILLNTTANTLKGTIFFFKDDGTPATFNFVSGSSSILVNKLIYTITPKGEFSALTVGTGPLTVGFALVVPDNGNATPVGTGLFVLTQGKFTVTTVGIPSSPAMQSGLILADTNPTAAGLAQDTGVALSNPSATQVADVTFTLRNLASGTVVATKKLSQVPGHSPLSPHGHTALFVDQIFTNGEATNFTGTLSIDTTSAEGVSALTLLLTTNQAPRGEALFTTLPVATASASTGPVFFPQLVSGAGFATQLILLDPALATTSGVLNFFDSTGAPVFLPLNDSVSSSFSYSIPSKGGATYK